MMKHFSVPVKDEQGDIMGGFMGSGFFSLRRGVSGKSDTLHPEPEQL